MKGYGRNPLPGRNAPIGSWRPRTLLAVAPPAPDASSEPPAPSASSEVQIILNEVENRVEATDLEGALKAADAAVEQARVVSDIPGEALGYQAKARVLEAQARFGDAMSAWQSARSSWRHVSVGPGEIAALGAEEIGRAHV